ncbi:MAG: PVC-type heme-binding CxxCH protein [Planctomycetota bacterium]
MWQRFTLLILATLISASAPTACPAACTPDERIPHAQDRPPGPPLSPAEAIAKMTVPEGFSVELIAAEPDVVNPVAMTIDERGRYWIAESLEYPRRQPGPGKDRIRVLEDTDGDGQVDKTSVFLDGLNIPSGIAVGHGGVWIANSPDILFVRDTDGDGRGDHQEVVVTGFGRDDTHELPNSLTWGPDGWLYGLNGVFNPSHVTYGPANPNFREGQAPLDFTCAMFRIHPRTREFQVFCEGTSNPWGIAFNDHGEAFVSACVIDHLWHLTQTGYYHRQGGPYPPFTWKIESIVDYRHQKAAYCGIHWYDSDAYPEAWRRRLYMGNIHGGCINTDRIEQRAATWRGTSEEDLLTANDAWFMPVVQKTGPDGCLCILDWYDRYHCYQDANRDPGGIDRLRGRLYRIHYRDVPRAGVFDLNKATSAQLAAMLADPNGYRRDTAQRLLAERLFTDTAAEVSELLTTLLRSTATTDARLRALGILAGMQHLPESLHLELLQDADPVIRGWAVRAAGDLPQLSQPVIDRISRMHTDQHPTVRLQTAITAARKPGLPVVPILVSVLAQSTQDPLTPRIVWQNLHPRLETQTTEFVAAVERSGAGQTGYPAAVLELLPRTADRLLSTPQPNTTAITGLLKLLLQQPSTATAADQCLQLLTSRVLSGEVRDAAFNQLRSQLETLLQQTAATSLSGQPQPTAVSALELGTVLRLPSAVATARQLLDSSTPEPVRVRMLQALLTTDWDAAPAAAETFLKTSASAEARRKILQSLGRSDSAAAWQVALNVMDLLPEDLRPTAVELLTDRRDSAIALMQKVRDGKLPASAINANQAAKMIRIRSRELEELVTQHWGSVRTDRDPARQELISRMRNELRITHGNPVAGRAVFRRVCAQCHKMYGEGAEVGPDITRNGRASFEQLISNVFDPSLVIGSAYQAQTVVTTAGRVVTGLLVENSPQRVVLKVQGDKQEVIPRDEVEEQKTSPLSLMPEGLEKQLQPEELHDLFAWLTLDRPPEDPEARFLPGSRIEPGQASDPSRFSQLTEQLLPGVTVAATGEGGLEILADYHGRPALRTHPVSRSQPCKLTARMVLPTARKVKLVISVASHAQGDWQLQVIVNGQPRHQSNVRHDAGKVVWRDVSVDLSDLNGQEIRLELLNRANDWANEFGFWNGLQIVTE